MLRKILRHARSKRFSYEPLVKITISKERLLHNFSAFQKLTPDWQIAPVLKSNAYGHGLTQIASILDKHRKQLRLPFLIVDSYYEAIILRNEGIISPSLIISYSSDENIYKNSLADISFSIIGLDQLKTLADSLTKKTLFHLKLDTGMSRHGIRPEEFTQAMAEIKRNPNIILEGIFSHLASSDDNDSAFTDTQIAIWNNAVGIFKKNFPGLRYWHVAATSGTFHHAQIQANMLRLGLGLYGDILNTARDGKLDILSVLEMKSVLSMVKKIRAGDKVGYDGTFVAPQDMSIATIPAGYFEGLDRRLSNCGFVALVPQDKASKGTVSAKDNHNVNTDTHIFCPIIGRISMNITIIDVSAVPEAKRGDEVILISRERRDKNSVSSMAVLAKTVPWEILVHIPAQLRRTVVS
jgi:alanine racemase